jgi:hypothetical protein
MHDVLIVGVPLLMILAGLFFNNRAISDLKSEIRDVRSEINEFRRETRARFDRVDDRLVDIYRIIGEHEGRLQAVERER